MAMKALSVLSGFPMTTISLRKDALTTVEIPVVTVLHLTDPSKGWRPVVLGHAIFFTQGEAIAYALDQSRLHPKPQRFSIYGKDENWIASYQCGTKLAPFTIGA
jgi:hypothetical protein